MVTLVDLEDIRRCIGEPDFSRGQVYHHRDQVIEAELLDRNHVSGLVSGSGRNMYTQDIKLVWGQGGYLKEIDGFCSCPVSYNCKHVAAVMLNVLLRLNDITSAAATQSTEKALNRTAKEERNELNGSVTIWLSAIKNVERENDGTKHVSGSSGNIYYVFQQDSLRGNRLATVKARILKDGSFGKGVSDYNPENVHNRSSFLEISDISILGQLSFLRSRGHSGVQYWPAKEETIKLCREVIETGRARFGSIHGMAPIWSDTRAGKFVWEMMPDGTQRLGLEVDGAAEDSNLKVFSTSCLFYFDSQTGAFGLLDVGLPDALGCQLAVAPEISPPEAPQVFRDLEQLGLKSVPLPKKLETIRRFGEPKPILRLIGREIRVTRSQPYIFMGRGKFNQYSASGDALQRFPVILPEFIYDGQRVSPDNSGDISFLEGSKIVETERDLSAECGFLDELEEMSTQYLGFPWEESFELLGISSQQKFGMEDIVFPLDVGEEEEFKPTSHAALRFMSKGIDELREAGWEIEIDDSWIWRLHEGVAHSSDISAFSLSSETDWFSFGLRLNVGCHELDLLPVVLKVMDEIPLDDDGMLFDDLPLEEFIDEVGIFAPLKDGTSIKMPGEVLAPIVRAFFETQGLFAQHPAESGRVALLADALEGCGIPWKGGEKIRKLGQKLNQLVQVPSVSPPKALNGELRTYQKTGLGWLDVLCDCGFGGLLADDMGLGKTVQVLALLLRHHVEQKSKYPSLLVVPTSLISNWENEATKFAPDLKLLILHGRDRKSLFENIKDNHLIVTTYPLLHRDNEVLFQHDYNLAILDEAQAVKNPASSVARKIRDIKAYQRIAMTGTPVENNLQELWAIFDWLVPGLLGDRKTFTQTFRTPIEKHDDRRAQKLLSSRVRPFLMRRTKEEVATDLPPKSEITLPITLHEEQKSLYETIRIAMDQKVRDAIDKHGLARSHITILEALLKLRQVCCDPALVKLETKAKLGVGAKRVRLMELIEELQLENRKVLIFSQFVEMLKLIEQDILSKGWDYVILTGQTKDRRQQIDRFQKGETGVFLISLKAGGVGLNLTAADTVILFDPWWNPAVEQQAMDRAHRIGQDKPVFVYKLIADGSVEAAIQEMQARKQALADTLFEGSGTGAAPLDELDIDQLLAPIAG